MTRHLLTATIHAFYILGAIILIACLGYGFVRFFSGGGWPALVTCAACAVFAGVMIWRACRG